MIKSTNLLTKILKKSSSITLAFLVSLNLFAQEVPTEQQTTAQTNQQSKEGNETKTDETPVEESNTNETSDNAPSADEAPVRQSTTNEASKNEEPNKTSTPEENALNYSTMEALQAASISTLEEEPVHNSRNRALDELTKQIISEIALQKQSLRELQALAQKEDAEQTAELKNGEEPLKPAVLNNLGFEVNNQKAPSASENLKDCEKYANEQLREISIQASNLALAKQIFDDLEQKSLFFINKTVEELDEEQVKSGYQFRNEAIFNELNLFQSQNQENKLKNGDEDNIDFLTFDTFQDITNYIKQNIIVKETLSQSYCEYSKEDKACAFGVNDNSKFKNSIMLSLDLFELRLQATREIIISSFGIDTYNYFASLMPQNAATALGFNNTEIPPIFLETKIIDLFCAQ